MADFRGKRLNVLQVTGLMNRGGAEVMLMDLYRNKSQDINFNFLINYKIDDGITIGDFDSEIEKLGGTIKYIGAQWDIGPIQYIKEFKLICKELGTPDVIHIHMNAKSGIICLAARLAGIKKIIVHSHGMLKSDFTSFKSILSTIELINQRLLINLLSTHYWACSEQAFASLFYKFNLKKNNKQLINNSIDVNKFLTVEKNKSLALKNLYGSGSLIIGVVGRIVRGKNLLFVVEVLKKLSDLNLDFICVIVGRVDDYNYMQEVEDKIKELKLQNQVRFVGLSSDIPLVMSTFDIFLSPSKKEAFGMVAVEAQASGLPCFLSNSFPNSIDMQLGLVTFIDGFNSNEWAEKIITTTRTQNLSQNEILNKFDECGFDVNKNIAKVELLYRS